MGSNPILDTISMHYGPLVKLVKALHSDCRDSLGSNPRRATTYCKYAGVGELVYPWSSNLHVCRFESDRRHQVCNARLGELV